MDQGRLEEASSWIAAAEAGIAHSREGDGTTSLDADAAVLRAVHAFKIGDVEASFDAARRLLELELEAASFPKVVAHCILGVTLYWRGGAPDDAVSSLEEAAQLAEVSGNDLGRAYALGYLAVLQADRGALDKAERLGRDATEGSDDPGIAEHFVTMIGFLALGRVAEQSGRLEEAERAIARSVELSERGAGRLEAAHARLALAHVRHAQGERQDARRLVGEARQIAERCARPGSLKAAIAAAERGTRTAPRRHALEAAPRDELTDRELAVLRLLKSNLSRREIGDALYVSQNTVKTHVRGIYRKLDASTREQAVTRARELGLL
jgi:LuxR family maltose regulon positive regulatory protein